MNNLCLSAMTGIGSLPFHEPEDAIAFLRRWSPEIPFWPQLPKRGVQEMMTSQFVANGLDAPFEFSLDRYSTWLPFLDAFREGKFPDAVAVKAQLAGPQTMLAFLQKVHPAESGGARHSEFVALRAEEIISAQLSELLPLHENVIIQLDEPAPKDPPYGLLSEAVEFIRSSGGVPMVHCCAPLTPAFVNALGGAILSFDIHINEPEAALLSAIARHAERGGGIAWGAAPTKDERDFAACQERLILWRSALPLQPPINLVTATCGLGTVMKREGKESFEICSRLIAEP